MGGADCCACRPCCRQGEQGEPGQKGSKGDKGEGVRNAPLGPSVTVEDEPSHLSSLSPSGATRTHRTSGPRWPARTSGASRLVFFPLFNGELNSLTEADLSGLGTESMVHLDGHSAKL